MVRELGNSPLSSTLTKKKQKQQTNKKNNWLKLPCPTCTMVSGELKQKLYCAFFGFENIYNNNGKELIIFWVSYSS